MTIKDLLEKDLKFILVGGKGGVGKTSIASAISIALAEKGKKTLLVSTDPAHSISDSFDLDFSSGTVTKVKGVKGELYALEINPESSGDELTKALGDSFDADQFSSLMSIPGMEAMKGIDQDLKSIPPPGMDEALSFAKILEYADNEEFDTIVLDTAPTGHTLRLLNIPEFLDSFIGRMLKMKTFISNTMAMIKSLFGGNVEKDRTIENLEKLKEKILIARETLMDDEKTQFIIVGIPTLMSIFESERLFEELKEHYIPNKEIVVNQINPENKSCPYCMNRRKEHLANLEYIKQAFPNHDVTTVEAFNQEIRGIKMLKKLKDIICK
ncbi:MAG: ArsA family ATPase [Candidatus Heimdallarchaeum aukensis]|uniref:ArsA family ATPase n=1 Tax=Candidatus Heimdallarchaeum aukensis TaxID=2876573 RepID=A0A9Y1BKM5_9ARCH|nr:MAG: ArsA family ATPase [Candidatus Heimdallarchaeum aukensis]